MFDQLIKRGKKFDNEKFQQGYMATYNNKLIRLQDT
jgi:hypothetical protein